MSELSITLQEYMEQFLKISTKSHGLQPLRMNTAQKVIYGHFKECYNNNVPCKLIILKARQMGVSTISEGILTSLCMTRRYWSSLVVAHESDSSTGIFDMAKRYYDNLPEPLKPMLKYNNAKKLDFQNPTNDNLIKKANPGLCSSIRVATAGKAGVGRGSTFQGMHLSEFAFWKEENGKTTESQLTGLMQTLPQEGFSLLIIESTANGYNYFKSLWDKAVAGESDFIPVFLPWYQMPEYRKDYKGESLTEDEKQLKELYHIDDEQIMWRRYAIDTLCGGSIDMFHQEYPATPEEAFILSGNPFFNPKSITSRLPDLLPPIKRGQFSEFGNWYDDDAGYIEIWQEPIPGHAYAIACDTAGSGSDYFVGYVLDKDQEGLQVAKYRAVSDERLFVNQIYFMGYYYNVAMVAMETNFSTYPTLALQEKGYPNLYVRETTDTYMKRVKKSFGFKTTSLTRPLILDMLKDIVNEYPEKIQDPTFFNEALSFVKDQNGKPQAATGAHDDCVMAMAIAYYVLSQARPYGQYESRLDDYEEDSEINSFINFGG